MEKYYKIKETELRELLYDSLKLNALESGGVDNWPWYSDCIDDFLAEEGQLSIYDVVDKNIKRYEGV